MLEEQEGVVRIVNQLIRTARKCKFFAVPILKFFFLKKCSCSSPLLFLNHLKNTPFHCFFGIYDVSFLPPNPSGTGLGLVEKTPTYHLRSPIPIRPPYGTFLSLRQVSTISLA